MIGEISALITAFLWSITSMLFASAVLRIGTVNLNISRQLFALIFLTTVIIFLNLKIELTATQYFYLAMSGLIGLTFGDTFLFLAYREIGARFSMLIMSVAPAIAALLAFIFLNERISLIGLIGIIITLSGIFLVVLYKRNNVNSKPNYWGLFYAFLAAFGQGAGLILAKKAFIEIPDKSINGFVATTIRLAASVIILIPVSILSQKFDNPIKIFSKDKKVLLLTIGGSIAGPFLGITFSLIAISHTNVGIASTIMALPPVIMLPLVRFFYNEKLTFRSVIGALIAVFGVAILFLRN